MFNMILWHDKCTILYSDGRSYIDVDDVVKLNTFL